MSKTKTKITQKEGSLSDKDFRENYADIMRKQDDKLNRLFRKNKIDAIDIVTDEPYEIPLKRFFKRRQRKR